MIDEAPLDEIDNLAVHARAQNVRAHHQDASCPARPGGRNAGCDLGQPGVLVRRGDFIERQPVRGFQIVDALGERFHQQPGTVEEGIFTGHWKIARRTARRGTKSWG